MPKRTFLQDLSVDELRWLLMEKRRSARQERLDRFRRTGRALRVISESDSPALTRWPSIALDEEDLRPAVRSRHRRVLDLFLLVVEVSAVLGFVTILFNGLSVVRELNREVVAVMEQPTPSPTPLVTAIVLPSGHTSPTSPGGAKFNDSEIPAHLRPLVQSISSAPVPTTGPEHAIRLQIPAIDVNQQILPGDNWEDLKRGVGQHPGSVRPGEAGNLVLSAHNDIFGETFRDLDRLKPGDEVIVYTSQRSYTYLVVGTKIVEPSDVSVMDPTSKATVTLISCYPYLIDNQRIVVTAQLVQ